MEARIMINTYIYCGETGLGKTTHILKKWSENILFDGGYALNSMDTFNIVKETLRKKNYLVSKYNNDEIFEILSKEMELNQVVILDVVEKINIEALKTIINTAILNNNIDLVFVFDLVQEELMRCEQFCKLIDWRVLTISNTIKEYTASVEELESYLASDFRDIDKSQYDLIISSTNKNYNNINKLMFTKKILGDSSTLISKKVINKYMDLFIENKFKELPADISKTLKQSSLIGEVFHKQILEDINGFSIIEVSKYLEEIEAMKIFIKSYINKNGAYFFISQDIHQSIYNGIISSEKKEWIEILINYYTTKLNYEENEEIIIKYLIHLKSLKVITGDLKSVFCINHRLLFYYQKIKDNDKLLETADELIDYAKNYKLFTFEQFIQALKIKILSRLKRVKEAYSIVEILSNDPLFDGSKMLLSYYKASCYYNMGNVDSSYNETLSLIQYLQKTAATNKNSQIIYSRVYSLMATIQNHFNIDDEGRKYYRLALNHAKNNIDDKSVYYSILKKCDMFFSYQISSELLKKCIEFYQTQNLMLDSGELYLNYATEMLFQESGQSQTVKEYLMKAEDIFSSYPNERLAYVKNNLAIYYIMEENAPFKALKELKESLFVDLSDFTYMTIYLNICMCMHMLNQIETEDFENANIKFNLHIEKLFAREHATRYEQIYKDLLDIILKERSADIDGVLRKCNAILKTEKKDSFLGEVLLDIVSRNQSNQLVKHSENNHFYEVINRNKIFLAEFRFWE